jgi:hypothetical protein
MFNYQHIRSGTRQESRQSKVKLGNTIVILYVETGRAQTKIVHKL